ncbi:MAG: HAD family hydrolase [Desulforhopalus sp.]
MIKALLFDFGRVISAQKPASLFARYESELHLMPGTLNTIMFESPLWSKALLGEIDMAGYWQAIGPQLKLHGTSAVQQFRNRYYQDEKIDPGVLSLLMALRHQYRLAVVSNHPPDLRQWLKKWNIHWLFEQVVCSGEEGVAKPDPAIFWLALKRLAVTPSETLFIDDTAEHVLAARALGMLALLFTTAENLGRDLMGLGVLERQSFSAIMEDNELAGR